MLAELARENLFVSRLEDADWYRAHSLLAGYARSRLEAARPGTVAEIHRRAADWLRAQRLPDLAIEHARAADDDELVADIAEENHLAWVRRGRSRTLLRWTETLPEQQLLERPRLAVASALAATLVGQGTLPRRRFLRLAELARSGRPETDDAYVEALISMTRAGTVEGDVGKAVADGRRAVELSEREADEIRVAALAGFAQALYFAGDADQAWTAAAQAIEHPAADQRPLGHAFARSVLALIAVERDRLALAETHVQRAREALRAIGSSRCWVGATVAAASGCLRASEGDLATAERELSAAEHLFRDEVATLHHGWLLALLAQVRCRRGRLQAAADDLAAARAELADQADPGRVGRLANDVAAELARAGARARSGDLLEPPSKAELVVLRMLDSDLSISQIAERLHLSRNTVKTHIRAVYRKLGVSNRADAVSRASSYGLLDRS